MALRTMQDMITGASAQEAVVLPERELAGAALAAEAFLVFIDGASAAGAYAERLSLWLSGEQRSVFRVRRGMRFHQREGHGDDIGHEHFIVKLTFFDPH